MKRPALLFIFLCALFTKTVAQWTLINNEFLAVQAITAFDSVIIISGQSPDQIYNLGYSLDYGNSWQGSNVAPGVPVNYLTNNLDEVFACSNNGIYRTYKTEIDWQPFSEGLTETGIYKLVSTNDIMVAAGLQSLFKRHADASDWSVIMETSPVEMITDFDFNGTLMVLAGLNGIAESTDLGASWTVWPNHSHEFDAVAIKGDTILAASKGGMYRKIMSSGSIINVSNGLTQLWSPYGDYYGPFYTFHKARNMIFVSGETGTYKLNSHAWVWHHVGSGAFGLANNDEKLYAARGSWGVWSRLLDEVTGFSVRLENPKHQVRIYPVPAQKNITIDSETEPESQIVLRIYNLSGRLVFIEEYSKRQMVVDLRGWPGGVYIIELISGDTVKTKRFVKY